MNLVSKYFMKSSSKKHTYFMIGSIVAAFAFSWMAPEMAKHTKVGGEIFLRCLMMVVVPLVMTSVMSGILGLGDVRKLGKPGGAAVLFYVTTTVLAVLTGVLMFNLIQPGQGVIADLGALDHGSHAEQMAVVEETSQQKKGMADIFENLLLMLFTKNLLQSMVEIELLPLIIFSIIFAGMLTTLGKRIKVVSDLVLASNDALLNFVMLLMKFAPLGIFCLVASNFGEAFAEGTFVSTIKNLAAYLFVVLGGLFFHFGVTLPLFL